MNNKYDKAEIIEILMRRDDMTHEEALDVFVEAQMRVRAGEDPEEVCMEEFGLEPDYVFALFE